MQYRYYQQDLADGIANAWSQGARNVMAVAPTGAGKTVLFSGFLRDHSGVSLAIAHRSELVGQMSMALARNEVEHHIIAARPTIANAIRQQSSELGRHFVRQSARVYVASVDTLLRRGVPRNVSLWIIDEGHHILAGNKWGKAVAMLPETARGLAVTATPCRADRKGLGRHADGLMDELVLGPEMRTLIDEGFLTDYRIFAPPSDLHLEDVNIGTTGDYSQKGLKTAIRRSHVTGDVVAHYLKIAAGKLGVTFATDVETATDISKQFKAEGVPAEVVSAKTPDALRAHIIGRFRAGEVKQLVNVDLFGEGFDLPALEVVSMARPTASYGLYSQQFGRALRPMPGKAEAIIIDHVGNVVRHGLPDKVREWTLDGTKKDRKKGEDEPKVRVCQACTGVFERFLKVCPYCGHVQVPAERGKPEYVDGDLTELDPATLAQMRGEIARLDGPPTYPHNAHPKVKGAIDKRRHERQRVQKALREEMDQWAGYYSDSPRDEVYRRFFLQFRVDVLTAQTYNAKDAARLAETIRADCERMNQERGK